MDRRRCVLQKHCVCGIAPRCGVIRITTHGNAYEKAPPRYYTTFIMYRERTVHNNIVSCVYPRAERGAAVHRWTDHDRCSTERRKRKGRKIKRNTVQQLSTIFVRVIYDTQHVVSCLSVCIWRVSPIQSRSRRVSGFIDEYAVYNLFVTKH